jgi:hypothetical protein
MARTKNYKTELQKILRQVDNDMGEAIMEMNHNLDTPNIKDCTQDECLGILETLNIYKAEGGTIQGEPITFEINI